MLKELTLPMVPAEPDENSSPWKQWSQKRFYQFGGSWGETTNNLRQFGAVQPMQQPPGALLWRWESRIYQKQPVDALARYFPESRASGRNFPYPVPDSDQFRDLYAEPVSEFVMACVRFREAAEIVSRHLGGVSPLIEDMRVEPEFAVNEAMALLGSLEAGIGPLHRLDVGRLVVRTAAVSLLSSFARMVFIDLARGRRIIRCGRKACDRIFVSDEPRARYCTPSCRNLELNARYRKSHERTRPHVPKTLRPRRKPAPFVG
jgi:hypothetical protein